MVSKKKSEELLRHFVQVWKQIKVGEAGIFKKISEFLLELFLDICDSVNALNDKYFETKCIDFSKMDKRVLVT